MSNQYNGNHHWNQAQNQMNFAPIQLEQEYDFTSTSGNPRQQQQQQSLGTQPAFGPDAYHYPQQQVPPNPNNSALHDAFAIPADSQQQRSRTLPTRTPQSSVNGGYIHGAYNSQQTVPSGTMDNSVHYRTDSTTFNFTGAGAAMQGVDTGRGATSTFLTTSPLRDGFAQGSTRQPQTQTYYPVDGGQLSDPHPTKRPRGDIFNQEESEGDIGLDQKDANKSKLSRACARCKNLKVRCEAKTETEPCKRCFNGGHECVIPGRKIRRTPPKREHLLNQIQNQAAEIERLIHELEKVTSASAATSPRVHPNQINTDPNNFSSPVLTPSTATSGSYLTDPNSIGADGAGYGLGGSSNGNNPVVNKAVEDWIAKARESLHEFGTFIGIGGAGMPRSYLVEDSDSSDEDEFVDVQEELDEGQFGNDDDRYEVAVQDPSGGGMAYRGNTPAQHLRHHSSNSSIGTAATGMTGVTSGTNTTTGTGTNAMPRPTKLGNESLARPANLPIQASPFGLFGNLMLKGGPKSRASSVEPEEEDKGAGIANEDFFRSTPAPNALGRRLESAQHQAPAILTRGIISPQEAEKLFKIYFDNMNLSLSLLDPVLYTAQRTFYRSPFLFTVICAIASRFYSQREDLYAKCMHYAQLAAGTALISGNKNVEMCSAYILLSLYPVPSRKWEDQRGWLYLGLAIRTATDLNLHLPTTAKPLNENHAREMLNRTRVWMNCLNLDRSTGSQYGKPPIISSSDYIANHSENWWNESDYNMKNFDIHICGYNSELKVMSAFVAKIYSNPDSPTGLNKDVDFERIATETDDQLKNLWEVWSSKLKVTDMSDPQNAFRTGLLKLAYNYSRLVALSYGFQHAFGKNNVDENPFLMRCLAAAFDVVDVVVHEVCTPSQIHFFRHGPEAQSVFVTFASAFLVKLLQPRFAGYLDMGTRAEIRNRVQSVINLLGSPEVAIDNRHGPKLYSRFLEKLLAKPMARLDPMSPGSASNVALPRHNSRPARSSSTMNTPEPTSNTFELPTYNNPSPTTTNSLSPPPTESALSFDNFAPTQFGAADPFAPETMAVNNAQSNNGNMMSGQFFNPPLPFDDHILQSLQSLTEPSGWQDINLPGFNWMSQFQQNLGMDLNNGNVIYDQNMEYLTGHPNDS